MPGHPQGARPEAGQGVGPIVVRQDQVEGATAARPPCQPQGCSSGTSQSSQGHFGGAPHPPQTSTSGRSQSGQSSQALGWNPLINLGKHKSGSWKKDLDCYMGAYFRLNYPDAPNSKWPELKAKFYDFLVQHHQEWKTIRENDPLEYLPYMEAQFERVTGLKLVGLGAYIGWIKTGSYYHWVVDQQEQVGQCPDLAGVDPPRGPMDPPLYPSVTPAAHPRQAPGSSSQRDQPTQTAAEPPRNERGHPRNSGHAHGY